MIAKGNLHSHGRKLAAYLVEGHPGERGELIEMRGFALSDLRLAFVSVEIQAQGTNCQKPFFHCYTRFAPGEARDRETWLYIADREEKRLGFSGQPRAVSFHHLADGSVHMHIAWSRIARSEDGRLFAIDPGLYKNKLKEVSRELEKELGLTLVRSERAADDKTRAAGRNEFEQARRLGTDLKAIRTTIRDCWEQSDSGKSFTSALEAQGLILARGDRRDFVIVDPAGGDHALSKRITGATVAETRARMSDVDRARLLSVDQAKAMQAERQADARTQERLPAPPIKSLGKTAGEIRLAWSLTRSAEAFAQALEERGLILVHVSAEEAKASQRAHAFAKAVERQNRTLKEGYAVVDQRGNVTWIDQRVTGDQREEIDKRLGRIDPARLPSVADAKERMRAQRAAFRDAAFAQQRDEQAEARLAGWQARTADREIHRAAATVDREADKLASTADRTVKKAMHGLSDALGGIGKVAERAMEMLSDLISPPPPMTHDQAERAERSAEEKQEARADESARQEKDAAQDELLAEQRKDQQEKDLRLSWLTGSTTREANLGRDENERKDEDEQRRERERER